MNGFGMIYVQWFGKVWRLLAVAALVLGSASAWGWVTSSPASAAGEDLRIKRAKVSVWPEYDDPRLLVIYEGEFADGGSFPREVSFKAPKDATIQMACGLTDKGEHLCQYYDTTLEGDFKTITFNLPIPTFYFEYYAGGIEGSPEKTINYQFVNPPYAIDSLDMEIQQPLKASNFTINPSSNSVAADDKGLKYYQYKLGAVPVDKALTFGINYTKSDPNPSVEKKSDADSAAGQNNSAIIIASIGGMAAIIVASYYISNKRNQAKRYAVRAESMARARQAERYAPPPSRPASRPAPESRATKPSESSAIFCAKCGMRLEVDDAFCFSCGEPARRKGGAPQGNRK